MDKLPEPLLSRTVNTSPSTWKCIAFETIVALFKSTIFLSLFRQPKTINSPFKIEITNLY